MRSPQPLALFASGLIAAIAAAGCGNGVIAPTPDAGFTINGHPFTEVEEGAAHKYANNDLSKPAGYIVELYSDDSLAGCSQIATDFHSGAVLQFQFPENPSASYDASTNAIFYVGSDSTAGIADGGSLTITVVDMVHIAGTYDVHFQTGEHLSGVFNTPLCD